MVVNRRRNSFRANMKSLSCSRAYRSAVDFEL